MQLSFSLSLIAVFLVSSTSVLGRPHVAGDRALQQRSHLDKAGGMVETYVKRADYGKPKQCSAAKSDAGSHSPPDALPRDKPSPPIQSSGEPYGSDTGKADSDDGFPLHVKGVRSSTRLPLNSDFKLFDPSLVYHGPGTSFGGGDNSWQGGACMLDDLPHANLPSVAMDQTYWQDGLACGTCVEISTTSAAHFSNDVAWKVEQPHRGTLDKSKKTVAIVSDLCPGVDQCFSGLDMHPDTWDSVTNGANGSKLPIEWRFVSCKEAFESTGSGGKSLQVHWRAGANPGFAQVQIRGSYQAVIRVEAKIGTGPWLSAKHVDSSYWSFQNQANTIQDHTDFIFRLTDYQGQSITTERPTKLGRDVFIAANFEEARA